MKATNVMMLHHLKQILVLDHLFDIIIFILSREPE